MLKTFKKDPFTQAFAKQVAENEVFPNNTKVNFAANSEANELKIDMPVMIIDKLKKPYEPEEWPVKSPLVYIQGTDDTLTPTEKTLEHFNSQPNTSKTFMCIKNGVTILPRIHCLKYAAQYYLLMPQKLLESIPLMN